MRIGLFFIIFIIGLYFDKKPKSRDAKLWWYLEWICLVAFAGLRYRVGGDSLPYENYYPYYRAITDLAISDFSFMRYQPLWNILIGICKEFSEEFVLLQIVHALIVNSVVMWFIRKYARARFLAMFFYFLFVYPYFNTEVLRESLAVCVFLLSYPYLTEGKWVRYYLLAVVAFLFHLSATILFFLPMMWLFLKEERIIRNAVVAIIISVVAVNTPFISSIVNIISSNVIASGMEARLSSYSAIDINENGVFLYFLDFIAVFLFVIFNKIKNKDESKLLNIYIIVLLLHIFIGYFGRFHNYFIVPFYVILSNYISYSQELGRLGFNFRVLKFSTDIGTVVLTVLIAFLLVSKAYYYFRPAYGGHFYNIYIPYHTVFDPVLEPIRENAYRGY